MIFALNRVLRWSSLWLMVSTGLEAMAAVDTEPVGRFGDRFVTPVNQIVTPAGKQVELPGLRPQALALSANGRLLAVSGRTSEILILDPASGEIRQRVALPSSQQAEPRPTIASPNILEPDTKAQVSFTGLVFSPDDRRLFLSDVAGSVKVFSVENGIVKPSNSIGLPSANAPRRKEEVPAGLAVSSDGKKLYVCGNLSNQLLELDSMTGRVLRKFAVGVAPYDVVLVGGKAYVSNWGGRRPKPGERSGPAGRGTEVKVDPVTFIANEGSVSVLDLTAASAEGATKSEIVVQLHSSALAVSPDKRYVVCANAASDNVSVIDTRTDTVVETIWSKVDPADLFGASPNALCFGKDGKSLYVANGTQNAIAVISFSPRNRASKLKGLIPVGWFPGAIAFDAARQTLCVANIKGHALKARRDSDTGAPGYNSHHYSGSLSLVPLPKPNELPRMAAAVYANYRRDRFALAQALPRAGAPARPVPERIGEPSTIEHVVYVIKENRTYDQVFGDVTPGNGDASLCIYGEQVTPNQHRFVRDFVLLDNTYCCGIVSADGHQWSTTAFGTDYLEKSLSSSWPRSYPDGMGEDENDALAYAPTGFLWDNAVKHGVTVFNFGEFCLPACGWKDKSRKGQPKWGDYWDEFLHGRGEVLIASQPGVESLRPFSPTDYVGWEMAVPDVWRARYITNQIAQWESAGQMPRLVLICLPNDHTSGTSAGAPVPAALVADNDLAFGRIVDALSHSRFWKTMAIFGIEDDPQNGWDHVSGYRTTAYVISPWAKRKTVISTQYNTTSLLRTMEQILGLPPMNQFDATATPMFDCFADSPDYTPFEAQANNIPLDRMNPDPRALNDTLLRRDARVSARLNLRVPDACPENVLNLILWRAAKGTTTPYPLWAVNFVEDKD
jgi:YVTN family beta-propeller protein